MRRALVVMLFAVLFSSGVLPGAEVKLIEAADAIRLIGKKNIVFVSGDSNETYADKHIIGSVSMPVHDLYCSDRKGGMPYAFYGCPDEAQAYIRSKGIKNNQTIIAYDTFQGVNASGAYSFFESLGHESVKLLNGGLESIRALDPNQKVFDKLQSERNATIQQIREAKEADQADELERLNSTLKQIEAKINILKPKLLVRGGEEKQREPSGYTLDPKMFIVQYIADKEEIEKALEDISRHGNGSRFVVIDARDMAEIASEKKIDHAEQGSRIPGTKFVEWRKLSDPKNKKSFASPEEMQKVFDRAGVAKDKTIYIYGDICTGRAPYIASALRLLGYENVKVFMGSRDMREGYSPAS